MRKLVFYLPLALFAALSVFLLSGLFSNPMERNSALLNKPLPEFALPDLMQLDKIWQPESLSGQPYLLNVWGTWCPTCNAELGYLTELREQGVRIIGLYYDLPRDPIFDEPFNLQRLQLEVQRKLSQYGDPYQFNILDAERTLSLDLGVSGAPETFFIDRHGMIRFRHIGDINPLNWKRELAQVYQQLEAQ